METRRGGGPSRWRPVADEIGRHGLLLLRLRQLLPPLSTSATCLHLHGQPSAWLDSSPPGGPLVDFDVWHRTVSMQKLYYLTLIYFFNVKYDLYISEIVRAGAKMCEILL